MPARLGVCFGGCRIARAAIAAGQGFESPSLSKGRGQAFPMKSRPWSTNSAALAGMFVLVGALAFAQSDQGSATGGKARAKPAQQKAGAAPSRSSSTHRSSKPGSGRSHTTSSRGTTRRGKRSSKTSWRRGQQKVDAPRAKQIQEALIREHYLSGTASGNWDAATEDALRRYQGDNGWQNKTVPDSRALIRLGLGPSHDHLLNPESVMTTAPQAARTTGVPTAPNPANPAGSVSQRQP